MSATTRDNSPNMPGPGSKRAYPKGSKTQLTPAWKQLVRDKLRELGRDHRWLAAQVGADGSGITRMLSDEQQTSSLVTDVCRVLGIAQPIAVIEGQDEHEAIDLFRRLSPRDRRHVLQTMELLRSKGDN
jgi:hypothetical protein